MAAPRSLRILMIHNRYRIRGGEDVSTDTQIDLLRASGHEVVLLEDSNNRIDDIGKVRTAGRAVWSAEGHRRVDQALAATSFDVVHVQNEFPLLSPSVYYAAQRHRIPIVKSLRNFRYLCPEGMLYRDGAKCTKCVDKLVAWPGILHGCYRHSVLGTAAVAAMSTGHRLAGTWRRRVFRYVVPSVFARDTYVGAGWDASQIDVIPNFIYPDPGPGSGQGGFALYAGRLAEVKGLDTVLTAWRQAGINYPLKIVGGGHLQAQVREVAAGDPMIEYLGSVDSAGVADLMGRASFVVVPTLGIESFGRVVAEAMAKGTPPVVADHGGLRETVTDRKTGLLFPPGDAVALAGRVRWLLDNTEFLAQMRKAARNEFLERFTGERVLARWIDLYRGAAGIAATPIGGSSVADED